MHHGKNHWRCCKNLVELTVESTLKMADFEAKHYLRNLSPPLYFKTNIDIMASFFTLSWPFHTLMASTTNSNSLYWLSQNLALHILYLLSHSLYTVTSMAFTTLSQQLYDILVVSTSSLLPLQQSQGLHCHSHDIYKHSHGLCCKHSSLVL
jgi:hypothetical protein